MCTMAMLLMYSFLLVTCPSLNHPDNGRRSCSLGGDGTSHPGDTCTFTCKNGYQLMGSAMRTCGSDGNWNGNNAICISECLYNISS